jgi:serine/threonine-protein kinase
VAPERIQADHLKPTPAVDQYALGVLFFLMLTGRLPFEAKDLAALLRQQLDETPPDLQASRPDLPSDLCRTVTRMLNKSPQARWPSLEAILRNLEGHEPGPGEEEIDTIELARPLRL